MTPFYEEVFAQLDRSWKNLRQIAEGAGATLSGSGWETAADALVAAGRAEVRRANRQDVRAPMGKVYRRAL